MLQQYSTVHVVFLWQVWTLNEWNSVVSLYTVWTSWCTHFRCILDCYHVILERFHFVIQYLKTWIVLMICQERRYTVLYNGSPFKLHKHAQYTTRSVLYILFHAHPNYSTFICTLATKCSFVSYCLWSSYNTTLSIYSILSSASNKKN